MSAQTPERSRSPAGQARSTVDVQLRSGQLELRFVGRFTPADLELIKAIDGRRWDMQRRVWLLPHSAQVVDALRRAFGLRLAGPSAHPANKPAQRPGPVGHAASAPRPSTSRHDGVYDASMEAVLDAMHRTMRTREYSRRRSDRTLAGHAGSCSITPEPPTIPTG